MAEIDYEKLYERVGAEIGWDFSSIKCRTENEAWNFYDEVRKYCDAHTVLLDIGSGGGEKVLAIAPEVLLLIGVDAAQAMIQAARANLLKTGLANVRFFTMRAEKLGFPEGFFQRVSCRHCSFDAREVARVLTEDGVFLTQQVSEADKLNIKGAFRRGQNFGREDGTQKNAYERELKKAGFREVQVLDYDATEYYQTAEDLFFLLKHTPIIPDFGAVAGDLDIFRRLVGECRTERGICTNSKRYLLIARK